MQSKLLLSAAVVGLALATPALAQQNTDQNSPAAPEGNATGKMTRPHHEAGVGGSEPMSTQASHIESSGRSTVAPRLPTPPGGENASAETYLRDAQNALRRHRTGEAQEALERAETAFLNNPANPAAPGEAGANPAQQTTEDARQALGKHNIADAGRLIDQALSQVASSGAGGTSTMGSTGHTMGTGGAMGAPGPGGTAPPGTTTPGMAAPGAQGQAPMGGSPGTQAPAGTAGAPSGQ
jgi:hypothetical protein